MVVVNERRWLWRTNLNNGLLLTQLLETPERRPPLLALDGNGKFVCWNSGRSTVTVGGAAASGRGRPFYGGAGDAGAGEGPFSYSTPSV